MLCFTGTMLSAASLAPSLDVSPFHVSTLSLPGFSMMHRHSVMPVSTVKRCGIKAAMADGGLWKDEGEISLPEGLRRELLPKHVAVIMDGNGRWAAERGFPTSDGHEAGAETLLKVVKLCNNLGIDIVSVFAFSRENWNRPKAEVVSLMDLIDRNFRSLLTTILRNNVRLTTVGNKSEIPKNVLNSLSMVEEATRNNTGVRLVFALDYSGRYDIVQACKSVARKLGDGSIQDEDIIESLMDRELDTAGLPEPDLLIRTGGESRVSNFFLWQSANTQLYFTPVLWPEFGTDDFMEALMSFHKTKHGLA